MRLCLFLLLTVLILVAPRVGAAQSPARQAEPAALRVSGAVADGPRVLNAASLEALGAREVRARPPWAEDAARFTGVPLARLLEAVEARGSRLVARDRAGHSVGFAVEEAVKRGAYVVWKRDGETLADHRKGPSWLIYPGRDGAAADATGGAALAVPRLVELVVE